MNPKSIIRVIIIPIAAMVIGILLATSCNEEYQYSHGSIYGTIIDANTKGPVEVACNVRVINSDGEIVKEQTTDENGSYKTKDISGGTYTLSVEAEDYYSGDSRTVQVKSGEMTQCDVTLGRLPAKITADVEEVDFGESNYNSFKIVNRFLDDLDWIAEHKCEWILSIEPNKGNLIHGDTETINITINRAKLKGGENKTNISVYSPSGKGGVVITLKAIGAEKEAPVLNVISVSGVDKTTAVFTGEIVKPGIPSYLRRGFTCSTNSKDDDATELDAGVDDNASFSYTISGLSAGKQYYVRAFAINESFGKVWSTNEVSFTTIESYPQIRTDDVTELNLATGTCILNGYIVQRGNPAYTERGFCVSNSGEPTINDTKYSVSGSGTGSYSSTMSGLVNESTYRVRAYTIQSGNVFYGSTISFSTATSPTSVATSGATSVTHNSAVMNGSILNEGNPKYTERGFCYSTSDKTPTITDTKVSVANSSSADFSHHLSNLEHNKTFWFRAYAIQNGQPVYGEVASFETTWAETTLFTMAASDIKYYEMTLNGQINDVGIPAYTQKGFCYSLWYEEPSLSNSTKVTVAGTAEGAFSFHLTDLAPHTTYYYRAYAIQDGTTIYGETKSANTYSPPQIITSDAYASPDDGMMYISWTVELNGIYGYKGDPECGDFGFVYGPGDSPSAENPYGYTVVQATKVEPFANSQGTFSVVLKEMVGYTKYYYRAYAKTSLGYTYGEVKAFSTQP